MKFPMHKKRAPSVSRNTLFWAVLLGSSAIALGIWSDAPAQPASRPASQPASQPASRPASQPASHSESDPASQMGSAEISHYTCAMHPSVKQKAPGACPICSMDLTPVTRQEVNTGIIFVDEIRRQRIGGRTASVARFPMTRRVRAVGNVTYDETRLYDVSPRMNGWIIRLVTNKLGQAVQRGQVLFTIYSPELHAAQVQYLSAVRSHRNSSVGNKDEGRDYLVKTTESRLRLFDIQEQDLKELLRRGLPFDAVPIRAPASGVLIEKNAVQGSAFKPGDRLFRIADLRRVWVNADVFEQDLSLVTIGQKVRIETTQRPSLEMAGEVSYVYPYLDEVKRTAQVRVELPNPGLALRPGMYVNTEIIVHLGERLQIPDEAVIYTGATRLVFVDLGEGRLRPKPIVIGTHANGHYEVISGLTEGERVVVSGNFLVAAESRIRSAARYWGTP